MANANFVGDFEAEWLVNRSGDIRLKAYNETNDRYYTRTNLTTQGIGIIFKRDFNNGVGSLLKSFEYQLSGSLKQRWLVSVRCAQAGLCPQSPTSGICQSGFSDSKKITDGNK